MNIAFGCIVIKENKILLVREQNEKSAQLEKWNLVSGKVENGEQIFNVAIQREVHEETGIDIEVHGVVGIYESHTPVDSSLYIIVGCNALSDKIKISDETVKEAWFFDLEELWMMSDDELVHNDMKHATQQFLDGKYITLLNTVTYT